LSMDASSVLWEVNTSSTGFGELGHVLSDVQTGRTRSGDWVAIFGNGYDSASGSARLYVVNLLTGALIRNIQVDAGGSNGLGAVTVVRDANQQIIGAYAGDLKGRMWKFDLYDTASANWAVGLNGNALFNAGTTKPITARPAVIANPGVGNVIVFGTGKLLDEADLSSSSAQSAYGILDSVSFGSATTTLSAVTLTNLVQQTITTTTTVTKTFISSVDLAESTQTISYFTVSSNPVSYSATTRGWYIDLPETGQRVIYPVEALVGRYVGVDSISPSNVSTAACSQGATGSGWLYFIDGLTGGGPSEAILDTNNDGLVNTDDLLVNGLTTLADGRNLTAIIEQSVTKTTFSNISGGSGGSTLLQLTCALLGNCPATNPTRVKTREWRQLFMR
jgi:type IV pilus assembly protein PilY1